MTMQKVRLTLDVTYDLNGESIDTMASFLRRMVERAIGEGQLTGETEAEVDEYSMDAKVQPEPLSEDVLADFMAQRIESGDLALEDIPARLARFGLMEPAAFVEEMRERMEMTQDGSNAEPASIDPALLSHPKTVSALECYLDHRIARGMGS